MVASGESFRMVGVLLPPFPCPTSRVASLAYGFSRGLLLATSCLTSIIIFPLALSTGRRHRFAPVDVDVGTKGAGVGLARLQLVQSESPHQLFRSSLLQLVTQPVSRSIVSNIFKIARCSLGWLITFPAIHIGWTELVQAPLFVVNYRPQTCLIRSAY